MDETNLFGRHKISAGIVVLVMISVVSFNPTNSLANHR